MTKKPLGSIDFVIPIYNEERAIGTSVATLHRRLSELGRAEGTQASFPSWRIVIMDNGSTDGSERAATAAAAAFDRVVYTRLEIKGRGCALRHTWMRSEADASLYMDVDLSTDLAIIPEFIRLLENGADLVVGSRLAKGSRTTRCFKREVLSRGYNLLIQALFRPPGFDDAQCGFKAVRLASVRPLLPLVENDHWFFDTELLLVAEAAGMTVKSVPVTWVDDPDTRVNIASTVLEDLRGLARMKRSLDTKLGGLQPARVEHV